MRKLGPEKDSSRIFGDSKYHSEHSDMLAVVIQPSIDHTRRICDSPQDIPCIRRRIRELQNPRAQTIPFDGQAGTIDI